MGTNEAEPPVTVGETESDLQPSHVSQATVPELPDLGLALSGGGVRATLFSLGVIIGLIETHCHRRVRCVTSVSGGSILNAALAQGPSLSSFPDLEKFKPVASSLAMSLAWRGVYALSFGNLARTVWYTAGYLLKLIGYAFLPLGISLLYGLDLVRERFQFDLKDLGSTFSPAWNFLNTYPWLSVGLAVLWVLLVFWFSRGLLQEAEYKSVVRTVAAAVPSAVAAWSPGFRKPGLYVKDWGEGAPDFMHVLVATDLLSGEPIYFSRNFVYCRPYGWSTPKNILTVDALYSSAAFPAVFPPKKLKLRGLDFQNGDMPGPLPRVIRLVDGGVYNNLGTDWFDVLNMQCAEDLLWPFGELNTKPWPKFEEENIIVVNAGAPSGRIQWLNPFTVLPRIMSVLYDNTVRPRVDLFHRDKRPLIDIKKSPKQYAEYLEEWERDEARIPRANYIVKKFNCSKSDEFWADFSHETAGTKTKLSRVGPRGGARLMLHGYLSSLVLCFVRFGGKLPDKIKGEEYFRSLVGPSSRSTENNAPGSPSTENNAPGND